MSDYYIIFITVLVNFVNANRTSSECEVLARTETGWVCGAERKDWNDKPYTSFLGIPYAKQPLGELRFEELQPAEPWDGVLNATIEGPVCPFHDVIFGPLMQPLGVSEACIYANVHVPKDALPDPEEEVATSGGLPVVVYIHPGGWFCGSGDTDFHGPEYVVNQGVVIITFNYRLDLFGLLFLNSTKVPGNGSLRDMLTLLRWVQANARYFGGDPDEVTLAGQSAGAASAHLLALSPVTKGLFKRIWATSGAAFNSFYTTSPIYSQQVTDMLVDFLSLNTRDSDEILNQLIKISVEELMETSRKVLDEVGFVSFLPVVETSRSGITTILPEDPKILMAKGYGKDIPMVFGFTDKECNGLLPRIEKTNILSEINENPLITLPPDVVFSKPPDMLKPLAEKVMQRYFNGTPTMEEYLRLCSDSLFAYPALMNARARAAAGAAPVYLYKFAYNAEHSAMKDALNLTFDGAGHTEDMTFIFKVNSWSVPESKADVAMSQLMSGLFVNFIKYGDPGHDDVFWPAYPEKEYFLIDGAQDSQYVEMSQSDQDMLAFYDTLTVV